MSGKLRLTLGGLLLLGVMTGCGTSQNVGSNALPQWNHRLNQTSGLSLEVSDESYVDGASAAGYSLDVKDYGEDIVVSVNVDDAQGLKALYFDLAYNPEELRPMTAHPTEEMATSENLIHLVSLKDRGVVNYGQVVTNFEWREGFSGDGTLAQVMFRKEQTPVVRGASIAPRDASSASLLTFDGTDTLNWDYAHRGDYNQDGLPTVSDLTPLGANFGASVAPADFPRTDAKSVIDGNGDGLLSINDLTPLGASLNLTGVTGYNVYAATDDTQLPTDPATPSPESLRIGNVLLNQATNLAQKTTERLQFEFVIDTPVPDSYYWVRPYQGDQDAEGVASNVILPPGQTPNLTVTNPPANGNGQTAGTAYEILHGQTYTLLLTDPVDGDVTTDPGTTWTTSDPARITVTGNQVTFAAGLPVNADLTIFGTYNSKQSNVLHFTIPDAGGGDVFIMPDPADADWNGVDGSGTEADPYILHDSTFNPDGDADDVYDLEFSLVANTEADGSGTVIPNDSLEWGAFPPFVALDINDGTPGTFHANVFSNGYVFAEDAGMNVSNNLYIEVKLDQN
jgi:hypothetical protein